MEQLPNSHIVIAAMKAIARASGAQNNARLEKLDMLALAKKKVDGVVNNTRDNA
jgi:hypothetical protein